MPDATTHHLLLKLGSPGTWSLSADDTLLAGLTGHDDPQDAIHWASHTLRTTHAVDVDLDVWQPDSREDNQPAFVATITVSAAGRARPPVRFERGNPLPGRPLARSKH